MRILIVSTSARNENLTLRFSKYLETIISVNYSSTIVELIEFSAFDFPAFGSVGLQQNNLSSFQKDLVGAWKSSDLVIFCCPEYNWSTNSEVYSMFEHLGSRDFDYLFDEKVFALVGVSSGRGGRLTALEVSKLISKLISFLGKMSFVSPKLLEAHEVGKNLDRDSRLMGHPRFEFEAKSFVDYTLRMAERWNQTGRINPDESIADRLHARK